MDRLGTLGGNTLWYLLSLPESLAFYLARRNVAGMQEKLLLNLIHRNADTDFGRRYHFASIRSISDYQTRVPLSTYDDYRQAIEQIGAGQPHLLTREPVLLLEPTSGSSAASKYIPYTATLKAEFQRAIAPWVVDLFSHHPGLMLGQAYWSVTPVTRRNQRTPGGLPIGFEEDSEYFGSWQRHLLQAVLAVPPLVRLIDHMDSFRYVTLLFLLRSRSLAFISIWNPTFLTLLLERLPDWWSQLTIDIANGTLSPPAPLASNLHRSLITLNRPNPHRAAEIQAIFETETHPAVRCARLWPHLQLISCWTEAQAARHLPELTALFPQVKIQGKGLIATEGFATFPLSGRNSAALAIRSHFFEFIPVDEEIPHHQGPIVNRQSPPPSPLLAHQLTPGRRYTIVITTGGGLYRYQLHDIIEVTGYWGSCPLLRFVGKETYISDWFGEKLNERHVGQALDDLLQRYALRPSFAMLACDDLGSDPAYTLFIEIAAAADDTLTALGRDLENVLQENYHYRYCRDLGQLAALRVFRIENDAVGVYLSVCQTQGQRLGDIKPVALHRLGGWSTHFQGRFINSL